MSCIPLFKESFLSFRISVNFSDMILAVLMECPRIYCPEKSLDLAVRSWPEGYSICLIYQFDGIFLSAILIRTVYLSHFFM